MRTSTLEAVLTSSTINETGATCDDHDDDPSPSPAGGAMRRPVPTTPELVSNDNGERLVVVGEAVAPLPDAIRAEDANAGLQAEFDLHVEFLRTDGSELARRLRLRRLHGLFWEIKDLARASAKLDGKGRERFDSRMLETFTETIHRLTGLDKSTIYRHIEFADDLVEHLGAETVAALGPTIIANDTRILGKLSLVPREHALDVIRVYTEGAGRKVARKLLDKYEMVEQLSKLRHVEQVGSTVGGTASDPYRNVVLYGDALVRAREIPDNHVHTIITSPPFFGGVRDYGTRSWLGGDPECKHGTGEHKDGETCACGAWYGQLGHEPTIKMFIEHLVAVFHELRRALHESGTCWIEIDDSRSRNRRDLPAKSLCLVPQRLAIALQDDGWHVRSVVIWRKTSCMPESVKDRCAHSYSTILMLTKTPHSYFDWAAVMEPAGGHTRGWTGGKVAAKTGDTRWNKSFNRSTSGPVDRKYARDVWDIASGFYKGAHTATFAAALVQRMITATTSEKGACALCNAPWERRLDPRDPIGKAPSKTRHAKGSNAASAAGYRQAVRAEGRETGAAGSETLPPPETLGWVPTCSCGVTETKPSIVLDPFGGTGTVADTAAKMGRDSILIENNEHGENGYRKLIEERLAGKSGKAAK